MTIRPGSFLALAFLTACAGQEAKQPNPTRPIDERRAIPIIAQTYQDSGVTPAEGRDVRLTTGKGLHVDVGTAGRKYGVAYLTQADLAGLDPKTDLPPHTPGGDLPVVQGAGEEADAVILLLFAQDYQYDDLSGDQHEQTTIVAEKKLARDVRDFGASSGEESPLMQADAAIASKWLLGGATLLPIGIALSAVGEASIGSVVSILGLAGLIAGLHTYGRAGPDPGRS